MNYPEFVHVQEQSKCYPELMMLTQKQRHSVSFLFFFFLFWRAARARPLPPQDNVPPLSSSFISLILLRGLSLRGPPPGEGRERRGGAFEPSSPSSFNRRYLLFLEDSSIKGRQELLLQVKLMSIAKHKALPWWIVLLFKVQHCGQLLNRRGGMCMLVHKSRHETV